MCATHCAQVVSIGGFVKKGHPAQTGARNFFAIYSYWIALRLRLTVSTEALRARLQVTRS